jgi:sugar (pentulose or hexulose) kinase
MGKSLHFLSLDLGAGSGRVMAGTFNGKRLGISEEHRFASEPVSVSGTLYTNVLGIWSEIKRGVSLAVKSHGGSIAGVGVDTWGVDFALMDKKGALLSNPFHYRDSLTRGILPKAFRLVPSWDIYRQTGLQLMSINTLYQLYALKLRSSPLLDTAHRLLMMPDLFNYWLSGRQVNEFCIATTSQCYDPIKQTWARRLLASFDLPSHIFGTIEMPGTVIGTIIPRVAHEMGLQSGAAGVPVIIPGCHDTALAVAAVPAHTKDFVYISCGTWSLMGAELQKPCINKRSYEADFTNEGGVCGTFRFLKNLTGLWILQECRRSWQRDGDDLHYAALTAQASRAPALRSLIDPSSPEFSVPGDMPEKIRSYCKRTRQPVPETRGAVVRCALESLALSYRKTLEQLETILNRRLGPLHLVGGGARNGLLCQLAADATGRQVLAGPVEATAVGSMLMQAMARGQIRTLEDGREIVRRSFDVSAYEPGQTESWESAYRTFINLTNRV